ncbi:MAG TPA: ABC transporter permease [Candidatus Limnocylindrales bacterium]|nr:ABC transporter permease [Candidatus Limnocylindrales bacterium]
MATRLFQSVSGDIRYALRMMRASAGLTAVAVLCLALGMGATIAIFSVIYALAIRPLPVRQPNQLVELVRGELGNLHTYAEWKLFRDRQEIFSSVLAYNYFDTRFVVGGPQGRQDVWGVYVSGDYFSTLGVSAALGRVLESSDDRPGAPPVCVLSYGLWRRLYGSQQAVGSTIRVDGNEFAIVGVAPRSFFGVDIGSVPEIFMPLEAERTYADYPELYGRQTPSLDDPATLLSFAARLKPGMSVSEANAGLRVLAPEIFKALPPRPNESKGQAAAGGTLAAQPMPSGTSDAWMQEQDMVLLLMMMAAVALIIVCTNLGNLLLARAANRRREIATRLALGATRWRLVRQLLTESTVLSVAGVAAGVMVAHWGSRILIWALSFPDDPILLDLSWDARLAGFAVGITLACALLFGLAPAIGATNISLYSAMRNGVNAGKPRNRVVNSLLVVVQVALSVGLLISAGLLVRTLHALLAADPGYDPKGVLTAQASWPGAREGSEREAAVGEELLTAFRSVPGVMSASWSRIFSKMYLSQLVVPGRGGPERRSGSYLIFVSSDFFRTRRAPILAGRDFADADTGASFPVAILSEDLAKQLFGGVNPVGLRFRENDGKVSGQGYEVEVVGVAKDMQERRPGDSALPILYRPVSQCGSSCAGIGFYEIRTAGAFAGTTKALEIAAATIDSRIVLKCQPLSDAINNVVHRNRAMALIATAFGLFVGLLAMMGVYGVTSHTTSERTREIAIRMALGAQRSDVFRMLLGEMLRVVCLGAAFGVAGGLAAARMMQGAIWGVKPVDPPSYVVAICLMLVIAGVAAFLPARRAVRVDPMVALRFE